MTITWNHTCNVRCSGDGHEEVSYCLDEMCTPLEAKLMYAQWAAWAGLPIEVLDAKLCEFDFEATLQGREMVCAIDATVTGITASRGRIVGAYSMRLRLVTE